MSDSILISTKKFLGLEADYHDFDSDVLMNINSAISTLHQLGIGPVQGFMVEDESTTWDALLSGDNRFNSAKMYVYLKTRMMFDPPATSFTQQAMQSAITELEWRLNVVREGAVYGMPVSNGTGGNSGGGSNPNPSDGSVFDGGSPVSVDDDDPFDGGSP
jgi:hypothetical protein